MYKLNPMSSPFDLESPSVFLFSWYIGYLCQTISKFTHENQTYYRVGKNLTCVQGHTDYAHYSNVVTKSGGLDKNNKNKDYYDNGLGDTSLDMSHFFLSPVHIIICYKTINNHHIL